MGHLERNLKSPTITTLEKITRALGITMSELLLDVPNNDSEIEVRQASMQHINYLLKDLSNEELDKITGILKEIIDWKKCNEQDMPMVFCHRHITFCCHCVAHFYKK